jgi:hypothetical protein
MTALPGPVHQIGYVVNDLDCASGGMVQQRQMQIEVIQQLDNSAVQPRAQGQPVERQLGRSSV